MTVIEEKPYHHGDLHRALLDAALRVIAERGVGGLTLREVARQAGVSHNAPYHHFTDKAALVAALVEQGFAQFGQALQHAYDTAEGTALDKLESVGVAYVQFALDHPQQFRLMFRPELRQPEPCPDPPLAVKPHLVKPGSGYDVAIHALESAQREGLLVEDDIDHLALAAWSLVHGLADLILDGNSEIAASTDGALELARAMVNILVHGLAKRD